MYSFGTSLAPNYYGYMTLFSLFMASVDELVQSCKVNQVTYGSQFGLILFTFLFIGELTFLPSQRKERSDLVWPGNKPFFLNYAAPNM